LVIIHGFKDNAGYLLKAATNTFIESFYIPQTVKERNKKTIIIIN